jgi:tetratricopeptide (TPR) repeat protein
MRGIKDAQQYNRKLEEYEFRVFMAYLNLQREQFSETLDILDKAEDLTLEMNLASEKILILHLKGIALLRAKNSEEAKNTAEELRILIEKIGIRKLMRHYYHLTGMISFNDHMTLIAIENQEKAASLLPNQFSQYDKQAFYFYSLSLAYYQIADYEKAQKYLERIVSLTTGRLQWGDIYAKSFYWLGKTFQAKRQKNISIENYEKFLSLWKDADTDHQELADAKKELDLLRNSPQD